MISLTFPLMHAMLIQRARSVLRALPFCAALLACAPVRGVDSRPAASDPDACVPWARPGWVRGAHLQPGFLPPAKAASVPRGLIRDMPYPFAHAVSITSDADLSSLYSVELFQDIFAGKYGLSVSQSFFYGALGGAGDGRPGARFFADESNTPYRVDARSYASDLRSDQLFLRLMYGGVFAFAHSFSDDGCPPYAITDHLVAVSGADATGVTEQDVRASRQRALAPGLGLHAIVECDADVKFVYLELQDQRGDWYRIDPFDGAPARERVHFTRYWRTLVRQIEPGSREGATSWDGATTSCVRVRLVVHGRRGATARLGPIGTMSLDRPMVERQAAVANRLGITQSVDIRHGGFTGQAGFVMRNSQNVRVRADDYDYALTPDDKIPCQQVWSADDPESPFRHQDILRRLLGVEVLDTFSHRTFNAAPLDQNLTVDPTLDGVPHYRLHRAIPEKEALQNLGLSVRGVPGDSIHTLGAVVEMVLTRMRSEPGQAAILYTHFASFGAPRMPSVPTPDLPCHPNVLKGVELLHFRHYDPLGDVASGDRVWVCKVPLLVRYAIAKRGIADHTQVDFDQSRVAIRSWQDPVLARTLPAPGSGVGELHGQTFFVKESGDAQVTLDGRPLTCFKRNPADVSGRQSVTLVDDSFAVPLLGELDPRAQGDLVTRACSLTVTPGALVRGHNRLVLKADGPAPRATWRPRLADVTGTGWLRIVYRKSNAQARLALELEDAAGVRTVLREDGVPGDGSQGWTVRAASKDTRDVVVDLADMVKPAAGCKLIPHGRLARLEVGLDGAQPGDTLEIDRVEMLRENPRPLHLAGPHVIVAGKLADGRADAVVHLAAEGRDYVAVSDEDGYYMFPAVPRGVVAEVWASRDGQRVYPAEGSAFLALNDRADVDL